ncbi:MAG: hypothetical protein GWO24_14835 [Akkermansiaceae bacterium]|nr:hypothetical protein [Akkermansiaceae bacterium]
MRAIRFSLWLAVVWVLAWHGASGQAWAASVELGLTVVEVSESGAGIEEGAAAAAAHSILGEQLRYDSLKILDEARKSLAPGDLWERDLPNGAKLRIQVSDIAESGALLSVDLEGSAQGDFRVQKKKPLVIGGPAHGEGRLVLVIQPN